MNVAELIEWLKTLPQDMIAVREVIIDCYVNYDTFEGESKIIEAVYSDYTYDNWHNYNEWTKERTKDKIKKVVCIS